MSVSELSSTAQDYLKMIWSATEWSPTPITVGRLAERMGVRPATVSDGIRRLADQGMIRHRPYGSIELTDAGRAHAVAMVRRHRLIETFLVQTLGYGWDEVHDEAEVLEHAVSDTLVERIDALLGRPTADPHGDPIPTASGEPRRMDAVRLSEAQSGAPLTVARISDGDADVLRYLAEKGIGPGTHIEVDAHRPYAGESTVRIDSGEPVSLGAFASAAVWVAPAPTSRRSR